MRIGLSKSILTHNGITYDAIEQGWYDVFRGHNLFFVPNTMNQDFDLIANDLDSFIITSGEDHPLRNSVELALATKMMERNKPVVGMSRGAIMIAGLLGGTTEEIKNHVGVNHFIFYRREVREVNSNHTRCIKDLPESTDILCLDYLGNTEAFINGPSAGVLWNPEGMKEPWIPPEIAFMLKV